MPQLTPGQARAVDPVLSNHAQAYRNEEYVLEGIFPVVGMPTRGAKVIKFDKTSMRRYDTRRAPGGTTKRIQPGYFANPVALYQDAADAVVPREIEEESSSIDINLQMEAVSAVLDSMMLNTEYSRAQIATDESRYGVDSKTALSGSDQFSESTANVKGLFDDAKEQVRKRIGRKANTIVLSPRQALYLEDNNKINDKFKYTSSESITLEMMARYFKVDKVIVPEAISLPEGAPEDADAQDVWGDFALACYIPRVVQGRHHPSYGYTYRLDNYPLVEAAYWDPTIKSMCSPVTFEESPLITSADGGFLFSNVTAP